MNFGALKSKLSLWTAQRTDFASELGDFINTAMHEVEKKYRWKHMLAKTTGNFTTTVDYLAIPTRYKEMRFAFITADNSQIRLNKKSYETMIGLYNGGTTDIGQPTTIATAEWDNKFYVRKYPDKTYPYEIVTYNYSADLSADADTNWLTDNAHELLLYGALIEAEKRGMSPIVYADGTTPTHRFNTIINDLKVVATDEELLGSFQFTVTDWVIGG